MLGNDITMELDTVSEAIGGSIGGNSRANLGSHKYIIFDKYSLYILLVGPVTDEAAAEACEYLAHYCRDQGKFEDATFYCSRLLEYPGSEGDRARALLKELHKKMRGRRSDAVGQTDDQAPSGSALSRREVRWEGEM